MNKGINRKKEKIILLVFILLKFIKAKFILFSEINLLIIGILAVTKEELITTIEFVTFKLKPTLPASSGPKFEKTIGVKS